MKKNVNNTLNMEVNIDINAYNNNRLGHFLQQPTGAVPPYIMIFSG